MSDLEAYGEPVAAGFDHVFRGRRVHTERSAYQMIEVFEHDYFGRMLMLDGVVQTTELDELCYHEMLVHPVLTARDPVERVLVIGGGDGGTLRRVLEHGPREVVMCELDESVVRVSGEYLHPVSAGALADERAEIVFEDGAAYVARHENAFDAIIVDSTDPVPVGPAAVLFSREFYTACHRALREGGLITTQSGSPFHQPRDMQLAVGNMGAVFRSVEVHLGFVPTYPGVLWSYTVATDGEAPSQAAGGTLAARLRARGVPSRYYSADVHHAVHTLPPFIAELVSEARAATDTPPVSRG